MKHVIVLLLALLSLSAEAKYRVCSITINSDNEIKQFKKSLNPNDFEFIELTKMGDANAATGSNGSVLDPACQQQTRCDVLVVSGHFGGKFFGKSGITLSMNEMSQLSCSNSCGGVFEAPKEVFLFGCNTLADKKKDYRTPQEYAQVLIRDGYSPTEALRIANLRYGPTGSTFADAMKTIFPRSTKIYGFTSIAPAGATNEGFLRKYFQNVGDYKTHLDNLKADVANQQLLQAFRRTDISEQTSYDTSSYRGAVCAIQDKTKSVSERAQSIQAALDRPDRMVFIPLVQNFVENNQYVLPWNRSSEVVVTPRIREAQNAFKRVTQNKSLRDELTTTLESSLSNFPEIALNLASFAAQMRWIKADQDDRIKMNVLNEKLKNINRENVDFICSNSLEFKRTLIDGGVLGSSWTKDKHRQRLFSCLNFRFDAGFYDQVWNAYTNPEESNEGFKADLLVKIQGLFSTAVGRMYIEKKVQSLPEEVLLTKAILDIYSGAQVQFDEYTLNKIANKAMFYLRNGTTKKAKNFYAFVRKAKNAKILARLEREILQETQSWNTPAQLAKTYDLIMDAKALTMIQFFVLLDVIQNRNDLAMETSLMIYMAKNVEFSANMQKLLVSQNLLAKNKLDKILSESRDLHPQIVEFYFNQIMQLPEAQQELPGAVSLLQKNILNGDQIQRAQAALSEAKTAKLKSLLLILASQKRLRPSLFAQTLSRFKTVSETLDLFKTLAEANTPLDNDLATYLIQYAASWLKSKKTDWAITAFLNNMDRSNALQDHRKYWAEWIYLIPDESLLNYFDGLNEGYLKQDNHLKQVLSDFMKSNSDRTLRTKAALILARKIDPSDRDALKMIDDNHDLVFADPDREGSADE